MPTECASFAWGLGIQLGVPLVLIVFTAGYAYGRRSRNRFDV